MSGQETRPDRDPGDADPDALRHSIARAEREAVFAAGTPDRAQRELERARWRLSKGFPPRPLEGLTVGWKDVFDVAGLPTHAGTRFLGAAPASRDHPLVAKLSALGAICVGKTSLSELAFSVLGENDAVPAPANPSNKKRVCGGSSSGSAAAVALRLAAVTVGTDCGGSVRLPAAWCGTVGFKPSAGRVAPPSSVAFSRSLDVIGVLGSTVAEVAALYRALSGHAHTTAGAIRLVKAPVPASLRPDPDVATVFDRALGSLVR